MKSSELLKKFGLSNDDIFVAEDGAIIVKRTGIKKIRKKKQIFVTYDVVGCDRDYCVILAKGSDPKTGMTAQAIASATPKNCNFNFVHETSEYRAEARVVLELIGLKELNVFSEEEYTLGKEIKKASKGLSDHAKELSLAGEFIGYVHSGENMGLLAEITQSDDDHYVFDQVAVPIEDVLKWNPAEHSFMKDDRSISDIGKMVKTLASKGVKIDNYKDFVDKDFPEWTEFVAKAPLANILKVISKAINKN